MINFDNILKREEERKQKAAVMQQPTEPQPDMNAPMRDTRDNLQSLRQPFQQMVVKANNEPVPTLDRIDPEELRKSQRNNYIQSFDTWADAEKAGDVSQQEWANQRIQRMVAEGKNPGDYLNMLSLLGEAETPAEKAKREKREKLGETFRNLGNLIGSAANLYYTNKGGQYIDLNSVNEKHRERMQRIKDKQDALDEKRKNIIINAKLGDLKNEQADRLYDKKLKASQAEKDLAYKRDLYKLEVNNAFRLGQIDAQYKKKLEELAVQGKYDEALEKLRQIGKNSLATINNDAAQKRAETRSKGTSSKMSALTYGGKSYKKNLSSMMALYNKLKSDGYTLKDVDKENANVNDYIRAITGAAKSDPNTFIKKADIVDTDILDAEDDVINWTDEEEFDEVFQ